MSLGPLLDELDRRARDEPATRWTLERADGEISTRVLDLVAPIGRGARVLVTAPPLSGATTLLVELCTSIATNHREASVVALLIDVRPADVTRFERANLADVYVSELDRPAAHHVAVAEKGLEVALSRALAGRDVVLVIDSLTRFARALNDVLPRRGRAFVQGGMRAEALVLPRRVFRSARTLEGGGSLTIIGEVRVDTGSKMDDVVFRDFEATGNTEVRLSRTLFEERVFPTIDILRSGTRTETFHDPRHLPAIHAMRRVLSAEMPVVAMKGLLHLLDKHPTNAEALAVLLAAATPAPLALDPGWQR